MSDKTDIAYALLGIFTIIPIIIVSVSALYNQGQIINENSISGIQTETALEEYNSSSLQNSNLIYFEDENCQTTECTEIKSILINVDKNGTKVYSVKDLENNPFNIHESSILTKVSSEGEIEHVYKGIEEIKSYLATNKDNLQDN